MTAAGLTPGTDGDRVDRAIEAAMADGNGNDGHARLRRRATAASLAVAVTLIVAKLAAWLVTGSLGVLSSLLDSLVDAAASLLVFLTVRHALRPPDAQHRFGHGKLEPLGALAQAAFLAGSALLVVFQAAERLLKPAPLLVPEVAVAVMVLSIALTLALVAYQRHVVRRTGSLAVGADQLHYETDLYANVAVIAALVVQTQAGIRWLDPLAGLAIAGWLLVGAVRIGRRSVDMLMDRELPRDDRERIKAIVVADPDVQAMHDLRTRQAGADRFIELHLELDGRLTLDDAHDITDRVEAALKGAFPQAEVLIHQEPAGIADHRLDDVVHGRH